MMIRSALLILGTAGAAHASCGFDACPRPQLDTGRIPFTQLSAGLRTLGLSADGQTASAYESIMAGSVAIGPSVAVGARVPFITVAGAEQTQTGLGNLVLNAEYRNVGERFTWRAGMQLETPTGADNLVDQHFELLPYGVAQVDVSGWRAQVWVGYRQALAGEHDHGASGDGHDGHDHGHDHGNSHDHGHSHDHGTLDQAKTNAAAALYAAGHAEKEALARLLVGTTLFEHRLQPAVGLGVQQAFGHESETFGVARAQVRSQLGETFAISVDTEVPVTDARRFDWAAGLRFDLLL